MTTDFKPPLGPFKPTSKTSEYEYARMFLEHDLCHIKTLGDKWYEYFGGIWRERNRTEFQPQFVSRMDPAHRTFRHLNAVMNLIEAMCQVPSTTFRGAYYKDKDAIHFNVSNGILAVTQESITLRDHDAACHFTKSFDVDYNAKAECPLYLKVLNQSLPDDADRNLLQLCFGNFLLPDCRFHTVLVCYGNSGCGKSTIADPVADIFGSTDNRLITNLSLAQICDPENYSTPYLLHASVNLSTELQGVEVQDSGIFKQLVFGESIPAREIRGKPFSMKTTCKLWFLTNSLPRFKNGTQAEINRIKFIRFDKKPAVEDQSLKDRLPRERSGIFNFMLQGLQRLMTLPRMPDGGEASKSAAERFATVNDVIVDFINKQCVMGPKASVNKEVLREAYKEFLESNNFPEKVSDYFFRLLKDRFPELREEKIRVDGGRQRIIHGIQVVGDTLEIAEERVSLSHMSDGL